MNEQEWEPFSVDALRRQGFAGFKTVGALAAGADGPPTAPGIYVVLIPDRERPTFVARSTGGRFKAQDPTVEIAVLQAKWVQNSSCLYIGKANNLRRRIGQYVRFGNGHPIGHWGGRYIWQLQGSENLIVAWKVVTGVSGRDAEIELLRTFRDAFEGRLPFANLVA